MNTLPEGWSKAFIGEDVVWISNPDGALYSTRDEGKTWHINHSPDNDAIVGLQDCGNYQIVHTNDGTIWKYTSRPWIE
jgi:hypothetical protein